MISNNANDFTQNNDSILLAINIIYKSNDIVLMIQDGRVIFANPRGRESLGYSSPRDLLNIPFIAMVHPDDRVMLEKREREDDNLSSNYTFRILKKDQHFLWVENEADRIMWKGRPATLNIMRNISELKRTEEALNIKNFVMDTSINAIALADIEGRLTCVNKSFLEMWEYKHEDEVLGKSLLDFLRTEKELAAIVKDFDGKGGRRDEMIAEKKDGSLFDVRLSASMITNEEGKSICMMASFVDISGRKEIEEALIRSEKLSSLGRLSAGLAHELRNPLAVISSCTQFCIENMQLERLVNENLQMIYRNSKRANKLINGLLLFAKPSDLAWKEVDVNEVVVSMLKMAHLGSPSFRVTFKTRLQKDLPKIVGDEEKLEQVFLNLIQNAVQAVAGKGEIIIQTRFLAIWKQVEINVIDDGPGIPVDYRQRIFDPFFTTKDMGTGLGLSICHSIIKQHKGHIIAECNGEYGTKISVRLPLVQEGGGVQNVCCEKKRGDKENTAGR